MDIVYMLPHDLNLIKYMDDIDVAWHFIEVSRIDSCGVEAQISRLSTILQKYGVEICNKVEQGIFQIKEELIDENYDSLHVENGGIAEGSDSVFYEYLSNWIILQGKSCFDMYKKYGAEYINEYILMHGNNEEIDKSEHLDYIFKNVEEYMKWREAKINEFY